MTLNENETVTLTEESEEITPYSIGGGESTSEDIDGQLGQDCVTEETQDIQEIQEIQETQVTDREEYERLIRGKYKEHFALDTQKLINRRFKKYKALEEKVKALEENAAHYAEVDKLIASERERAIRETEDRMNRQFRAQRSRADENALTAHLSRPELDVSRLTKSERAQLAKRAQKGEKIHL